MITQNRLKELLHYSRTTGHFTWRVSRGNRLAGSRAGTVDPDYGYINIGIDGSVYRAHRLAFLYVKGYMPVEVDHRNRTTNDNRWRNLREATRSSNMHNTGTYASNTSGYPGVRQQPKGTRFEARIRVKGKLIQIGTYDTPEQAYTAYLSRKRKL